ncbi:MAG: GNAT family N-acetyltransferase [Acidobacteriota bacterium]|jgi:aminoglycoside 3-N-acetyltransferase I
MSDEIEIIRLKVGDEALARKAMSILIPEEESEHQVPTINHLKTLLANNSNCLILALIEELPVGFTIAYSMPRYSRDGQMAYLFDILVHIDHRRKGIGSRMIELLKKTFYAQGVDSIWVGTDIDNSPAIALYEATEANVFLHLFMNFGIRKC